MSAPENEYQEGNPDAGQDDYVSRTGQNQIPVQSDNAAVEEGGYENPEKADSDQQLESDDRDAIDSSNIIDERTRGAKPSSGYAEPGDEEGLPTDDGTSST